MQNNSAAGQKVLVTGGAGYLGSVLVPRLLELGHKVVVYDCLWFGDQSLKTHPNLRWIRDDILNHENHLELFRDIDAVVHLAAISNDPSCDLDPNLTVRVNYFATLSLARRAKSEGVKRFITMSSASVYGASGDRVLDESAETGPVTLYALTKLQSEQSLAALSSPEFAITQLRLATLFGFSPRMRFDLAVNVMTKRGLMGQEIIVNGAGSQYRPFLHVKDAARAIQTVLDAPAASVAGQIFNVGRDDLNMTIQGLAETIHRNFPKIALKRVLKNEDIRSYRLSFKKIREQLGFISEHDIDYAVTEICAAHARGALVDMDDARYYNLLVMKRNRPTMVSFYSPAETSLWAEVLPRNGEAAPSVAPSPVPNQNFAAVVNLHKPKIVGVILAYNCERMLDRAMQRIPRHLLDELILMDDGSQDGTAEKAMALGITTFRNAKNLGYGGNLKAGLQKALALGADYVVEIHGDGAQFDPISIEYAIPYMRQGADLILGSRFLQPGLARKNGMPLIRFVANRFLSFFDRIVLKLPLTEFHTGFRIYSRTLLEAVPYESNADNYLFSFQIIAQAAYYRKKVAEVPVEADYHAEHTSHAVSGAAIYAIHTFIELTHFVAARLGIYYNSVFRREFLRAKVNSSSAPEQKKVS